MAFSDITGIFSRYFVVGFFLPAFVSLISFRLTANADSVPDELASRPEATELLILGGVAVVLGLALSGGSYYITRLFEGYPLDRLSGKRVVGRLHHVALLPERRRFGRLFGIRENKSRPNQERARAGWTLDRSFPRDEDDLLPTRLGNALRAFERHSNVRWGLDGITIWPRIEMLLSAEERELHVDAKIDFYVFLNAAFGAFVVGACLIVDKALNTPSLTAHWLLYGIPFLLGYVLYRASITPAIAWGDVVRSSIDLHRLEIYEKLGVRTPRSFTDERELADKVNKHLLYGRPLLKDELWRGTDDEKCEEKAGGSDLLAWLNRHLMRGA